MECYKNKKNIFLSFDLEIYEYNILCQKMNWGNFTQLITNIF